MPVTRRRRRYTMLWFGLFLVSVTVIDSSYFVRQRDIALNTKNSSFHSGVPAVSSGERQLTPATGSRDSGRRRQDEYTERRDWIESMSRRHRRSKRQNGTEIGGGLRRQRRNKFLCHRYDLFVDVERLGWADTVVYPRRFNIRYCAGRCPLVIRPPNIDVSNHAVLRALVRHHHRHRSACCVATSLRPMNLLYRDKQGHFDIWKINDVIVDTCGCR